MAINFIFNYLSELYFKHFHLFCDIDGFGMYIYHGGKFLSFDGGMHYVGGHTIPKFDFDADRFGYLDVEDEIGTLGYFTWNLLQSP